MANHTVNLDQLQYEIDEAEKYLRNQINVTTKSSQKKDQQKVDNNNNNSNQNQPGHPQSKVLKKRYADPAEREKLLQRLLTNHHNKNHSNISQTNSNQEELIPESTSSFPSPSPSTASNDNFQQPESTPDPSPHRRSGAGPAAILNDTLFYASDITPTRSRTTRYHNSFDQPSPSISHHQHQHQHHHQSLQSSTESRMEIPSIPTENEEDYHSIENDSINSNHDPSRYGYQNLNKTTKFHEKNEKKRYQKTKEELQQEAREEFNRQYTFQPNLISKGSLQSSYETNNGKIFENKKKRSNSVNRIDAMLRIHEQKLRQREQQKQEVERVKLERFCTFQPEICPGTNQILQKRNNVDEGREGREGRGREGRERSLNEYQQPTRHLRPSSAPTRSSSTSTSSQQQSHHQTQTQQPLHNVTDRLYFDATKKQNKQQMIQQHLHEQNKSQHTFHPTINPKTYQIIQEVNGAEYRPLYERVGDIQRSVISNKQILLNSYEEERRSEMTFQPKIDKKSQKIIEKKRVVGGVASVGASASVGGEKNEKFEKLNEQQNYVENRLLEEGKKQMERKHHLLAAREQELSNQIKTPKPCKGSQEILEQKPSVCSAPFLSRQDQYLLKTKEHLDDIRKEHERRCDLWFKPSLSENTTTILSTRRHDLLSETIEERIKRLTYDDIERNQQNKQQIEREMYAPMTFTPEINEISKELGKKSTIIELHHNYRGRRVRDRIKLQVENKESQECSFKPEIMKSQESYQKYLKLQGKYSPSDIFSSPISWNDYDCPLAVLENGQHITSHRGVTCDEIWRPLGSINMSEPEKMARDIKLKLQEKEEKRQQELILQEIVELKECTFQPKINSTIPTSGGNTKPVVVKGLGRHLELRNLLNKQKELELKRKKEAFQVQNVEKFRSSVDGLTIVQPFHLQERHSRRSRAVMELEEEEEENLTFSPTTNERNRREIARRIISNI